MKKLLASCIAAALVLCCTAVLAESQVTFSDVRSLDINPITGACAVKMNESEYTHLYDAQGNQISGTDFVCLYPTDRYFRFRLTNDNNGLGLIASDGKVIVPAEYIEFQIASDRWILAAKGTPTTSDAYDVSDYTAGDAVRYVVDKADVYFRGTLVGSISAAEYKHYPMAYGDYLQTRDDQDVYHHYNSAMVDSGNNEVGEYSYDSWIRAYSHTGTNQPAFTPECTLTADEVTKPVNINYDSVVDLQGNLLFVPDWNYGSYDTASGTFSFLSSEGKYGLLNKDGSLLLPAEYDSINYDFADILPLGYVPVVKDGMAGFAAVSGADTSATFCFPESDARFNGMFCSMQDENGKTRVVSATAGLLNGQFEDVSFLRGASLTFTGLTADGKVAVYGLNGEELLTHARWRYAYDARLAVDGRTVAGQEDYSVYTLYTLDYEPDLAPHAAEPAAVAEPAAAGPATISGQVRDAVNRDIPIIGAKVEAFDENDVLAAATTTDENGQYTFSGLFHKLYKIVVSSDDHISFTGNVEAQDEGVTYVETYALVAGEEGRDGSAAGHVVSAFTGQGLPGIALTVYQNWNSTGGEAVAEAVTDENGAYELNLPIGNYTVVAALEGYTPATFNIVVTEDKGILEQNGTITPNIADDEWRIVLTWAENPRDLDSHLVDAADPSGFHVYFNFKSALVNGAEICNLDVDDTGSYGPETVTLRPQEGHVYYYFVHNYAGEGTLSGTSEARVAVYNGPALITTFNVPTDGGENLYWNVFALKDGQMTIANTITDSADISYAAR